MTKFSFGGVFGDVSIRHNNKEMRDRIVDLEKTLYGITQQHAGWEQAMNGPCICEPHKEAQLLLRLRDDYWPSNDTPPHLIDDD